VALSVSMRPQKPTFVLFSVTICELSLRVYLFYEKIEGTKSRVSLNRSHDFTYGKKLNKIFLLIYGRLFWDYHGLNPRPFLAKPDNGDLAILCMRL
jgi:hypothetical protein